MYLKTLTLKGFKSFADTTTLTFDPTMSVVVGPNGSGKSNISDAILWVLGEQSAKNLRGQAMEDVIFAGSSSRPSVSYAQVTLVLDNSDGTLPFDFSDVSITRRMYRSGESEYLVNKTRVRLRDIYDILHDSGLGKDMRTVISQGKLDSILVSKPSERAHLVEDAAGISKSRKRKALAEKKLSLLTSYLSRARTLKKEVNAQLIPIERQMKRARSAKELSEKLQVSKTVLAVDDLMNFKAQYTELEERIKEGRATEDILSYKRDEAKKTLRSYQALLEQKGLFAGDLAESRRRIHDIVGRFDSDMRLLSEKGKNMVERISELRRSLSNSEHTKKTLETEASALDARIDDANACMQHAQNELSERSISLEQARSNARDAAKRLHELKAKEAEVIREREAASLQLQSTQRDITAREEEEALIQTRVSELTQRQKSYEDGEKEKVLALDETKDALGHAQAHAKELAQELEDARGRTRALEHELKEQEDARLRTQAGLAAAQSLLKSSTHTSSRIDYIHAHFADEIAGNVLDLIEVDKGFEGLAATALGENLSLMLVKDKTAVLDMLKVLGDKEGAVAFIQSGEGTEGAGAESGAGDAADFEDAEDAEDAALPSELLDRALLPHIHTPSFAQAVIVQLLAKACVVDTAPEAYTLWQRYPDCTFVARTGVIVSAGRIHFQGDTRSSALIQAKQEIRELTPQLSKLDTLCAGLRRELDDLQAKVHTLSQNLLDAKSEELERTGKKDQLMREIQDLKQKRQDLVQELASLEEKKTVVSERLQSARTQASSAEHAYSEAHAALDSIAQLVGEAKSARDEAYQKEREYDRRLSQLKLERVRAEEQLRSAKTRRTQIEQDRLKIKQQICDLRQSASALNIMRLRVDPLYKRYELLFDAASALANKLASTASLAEADSRALKDTIHGAENDVTDAETKLERAHAETEKLVLAKTTIEAEVKHVMSTIEHLGMDMDKALELERVEDRELLEAQIAHMEQELAHLGPVNEMALEEYARIRARFDFISAQVDDLKAAQLSLMKITRAIDKKMHARFMSIFKQVDHNFQEIFGLLFPGGSAHLELLSSEEEDAAPALEIFVQPRGKKIQTMSLLSGGEKSLCALALLFATYKIRTVPFYVFDEIEAALDDVNLSKLLVALQEMKKTTQLIVISHQRRTMEEADVLWGVSMHADGVSTCVSQRLKDGKQQKKV